MVIENLKNISYCQIMMSYKAKNEENCFMGIFMPLLKTLMQGSLKRIEQEMLQFMVSILILKLQVRPITDRHLIS